MPSQARRLGGSVLVPCLAVILGCAGVPETNQQACHRFLVTVFSCEPGADDDPSAVDEIVSSFCSEVRETDDCDFAAVANCVAGLSCDGLSEDSEEAWECLAMIAELDSACLLLD